MQCLPWLQPRSHRRHRPAAAAPRTPTCLAPPPPAVQQFYIVRVDAPPSVATLAGDGCYVTVESGPHQSLAAVLTALQQPGQRVRRGTG